MKDKNHHFDHDKLDVYQAAMEFIILTDTILPQLPKGRGYLVDQCQRASTSILLNIAEGAGEISVSEKIRFYRMARRSATECAAILETRAASSTNTRRAAHTSSNSLDSNCFNAFKDDAYTNA